MDTPTIDRSSAEDENAMDQQTQTALGNWLAERLQARSVTLDSLARLAGGAIQENLALEVTVDGGPWAGPQRWVLRRDAPAAIAESHDRLTEHRLLEAVWRAGLPVPQPIVACTDAALVGTPFSLMRRVDGEAFGPALVKRTGDAEGEPLVQRLGELLAAIHALPYEPIARIVAPADSPARQPKNAALGELDRLTQALDALPPRPGLELALRLARSSAPDACQPCVLHRDFRTGNLMVDRNRLVAVLDWEFAGLGDPMADLGWFCARCWRFSRPDREAGGLGSRRRFYAGYESASGAAIDESRVRWWEHFAQLRWAVIALQQGARHASGREPSLAHALTGRMADALERDGLGAPPMTTEPEGQGREHHLADSLDGDTLLEAGQHALGQLIDAVPDESVLTLRQIGKAMRIARREIAARDQRARARANSLAVASAGDSRTLAHAIRSGAHDQNTALHEALRSEATLRAWTASA